MLLGNILNNVVDKLEDNIEINNVTQDSRTIVKGDLFVSIPCSDQLQYINQAVDNGCVAIVGNIESTNYVKSRFGHIACITHDEPRFALAIIAKNLYPLQPECNIAVTGTNGKSSTVHFVRQIFDKLGKSSASLGTLGLQLSDPSKANNLTALPKLTTPDAFSLHKALDELNKENITHVAFEASSHGLNQYRLHGVKLKAAAFTNLTQDHLDYHTDMGSYFAAKAKLFEEVLPDDGVAVLNRDDAMFGDLLSICEQRQIRVISYSCQGIADIQARNIRTELDSLIFDLQIEDQLFTKVKVNILGRFQIENILACIGLVMADGISPQEIIKTLPKLTSPDGRMELVGSTKDQATIYIDFGHTPEALRRALESARQHASNNLHVVFGCGGNRDPEKRMYMGRVAQDLADYVYVTDDNPRHEDPKKIRQMVLVGCPDAKEIAGRDQAIYAAINELKTGDILVITGKGHEDTQIIGNKIIPFMDKAVVQSILGNKHVMQQGA